MKKSLVITSALMSCFLLTACGSQSSSSKQSSSHSSSKAVAKTSTSKKQSVASSSSSTTQTQKYTDEEYAMMGFLKQDGQGIDNLLNNAIQNMNWKQSDNSSSSSSSTQDQNLTQQASSILYYGANKLNNEEFKNCYDFAVKNSQLDVSKVTDDKGNTLYHLAPSELDSYIAYSVDADGTIHFYKTTPTDSGEIGTASQKDINSFVSSQKAADQVNQLANAAKVY